MDKRDYLLIIILTASALLSRIPLIEKFHSHWDGPQYTIAVIRFSYEHLTPSPPGYPLYIAAGKLFYPFVQDPHKAILFASVLGSVIGSVVLYLTVKSMFNRIVAILASLIFLTGSTFYYFSLTPYGFSLLYGFEILVAYWIYRIYILNKKEGLLYGLIVGICLGIRPQEFLQIAPMILFGLYLLPKKEKIKSIWIFFIITLLWLVPIVNSMGILKFLDLSYNHLLVSIFNNSFLTHIELMIKGFLLSFGIASLFLLYYVWFYIKNKSKITKHLNMIIFFAIWILPGLLYNLFIRTEHAGYQISYLTAFTVLIGYAVWRVTRFNKYIMTGTIIVVSLFNLFWFFYNRDPNYVKPYRPTSFHYSDIRKNDLIVGSKINYVINNFDPQNTFIISTEVLWRPYSYYLKNYRLTALNALDNTEIPYTYNRYDALNWNMKHVFTNDFVLIVPENISRIVFMDDNAYKWIKKYPYKKYNLNANSSITVINVPFNTKILYNYHSIEIQQK